MIIFTAMRGQGPGTPPGGRGRGPRPPSAAARGAAAGPPVARGLGAEHAGMIWNRKILVESRKNICMKSLKSQKIFLKQLLRSFIFVDEVFYFMALFNLMPLNT